MHFGQAPRFEVRSDGTIITRAGTQTNCAGIARLHIRIVSNTSGELTCGPAFDPAWEGDRYGSDVPGRAVPEEFREAAFKGAGDALIAFDTPNGAYFEILNALVHMVDARGMKFWEAGYRAMAGWLESQGIQRKHADDAEPCSATPPN